MVGLGRFERPTYGLGNRFSQEFGRDQCSSGEPHCHPLGKPTDDEAIGATCLSKITSFWAAKRFVQPPSRLAGFQVIIIRRF